MTPTEELAWDRLGERLSARVKELSITKAELIRRSGVKQPTLDRYLSGSSRKKKRDDKARDLAIAVGWTPGSIDQILAGGEPELAEAEPVRGRFPAATTDGHGGSEGWSEFLEVKFNEAIAVSHAVRDEVKELREEFRRLQADR